MDKDRKILKLGDDILSEQKAKNINHITTQLDKDNTISYNTGFHDGFMSGYLRCKAEMEGKVEKIVVDETPVNCKKEIKMTIGVQEMNCSSCSAVTGHTLKPKGDDYCERAWTCTICGNKKIK